MIAVSIVRPCESCRKVAKVWAVEVCGERFFVCEDCAETESRV